MITTKNGPVFSTSQCGVNKSNLITIKPDIPYQPKHVDKETKACPMNTQSAGTKADQ